MDQVFTAVLSGPAGIAGVVFGSVLGLLAGFLTLKMWRYRSPAADRNSVADFSIADFSIARYQPMMRLFSEEDLEFLASQRGCRPDILSRLRRDRRRIFRMYLRELAADFHALHAEARKIAAISPEPHAQLIASLMRQQVMFWWALAALEIRLMLPLAGGLDLGDLIASVEALRLDLAKMAA